MSINNISIDDGVGTRMESVSSVAIRNIGPDEIDPDDPDQRKLISQMKNMHAINIWGYSDNQPWFLAGLTKANPAGKRLEIESMVKSINGSEDNLDPTLVERSTIHDRKLIFKDKTSKTVILKPIRSDEVGSGERSFVQTIDTSVPQEMKMIIKKTLELVTDMTKSVQLVYHAIRALARFMTYPTPSLPSDNYVFGHVKGWIWLIYKALSNFQPTCPDSMLSKSIKRLHKAMTHLAHESLICSQNFSKFNESLKNLHESIRKEGKSPKSQGHIWTIGVHNYMKFSDELKLKDNLLVDIKEDRAFASDWIFEPHPSLTRIHHRDFFHFQWIKTRKNWATDEFEIRSDYSTRWHPYSDLSSQLQIELILYIIEHFTAVMDECNNFINCNMHLTFDFDEVKCLKFAVAEIHGAKNNLEATELIGDRTKRLFEDMALLEQVSMEFQTELDWIVDIMEPCYDTVRKWLKPELFQPLGFTGNRLSPKNLCCGCIVRSQQNFLDLYGDPMQAVLLRTPITPEMVKQFFPSEHLVNHDLIHMPSSSPINAYGVSEGYFPSLFDKAIGRDPPLVTPKKLPKVRRRSLAQDQGFNIQKLKDLTNTAIRPLDGKLDTEIYLKIIEQIKKFLQTVGPSLNFIVSEVTERFERLENLLYTELSDNYESLESIVDHEIVTGVIESDPLTCGTRCFRRLHTVFLFVVLFLDSLSQQEEFEATAYTCKAAYNKSFSKYHSWFIQKTQTYPMYALPIKGLLYEKLCPEKSVQEADVLIGEFVKQAKIVSDHCQEIFDSKKTPDL